MKRLTEHMERVAEHIERLEGLTERLAEHMKRVEECTKRHRRAHGAYCGAHEGVTTNTPSVSWMHLKWIAEHCGRLAAWKRRVITGGAGRGTPHISEESLNRWSCFAVQRDVDRALPV
jgi:hypothetical protein